MASAALDIGGSKEAWRTARWDALLVALAGLHAVALIAWPTVGVIAIGIWWNSNTIAHNFIHRPFFRSRFSNLSFLCCLSVLLGIPQALWRDRHLAHHAGRDWQPRISPQLAVETVLVLCLWTTLAVSNPRFFLTVYLPGYCIGLALCTIHGYYEHKSGVTSHYGRIYNLLTFNDGYHAEHHTNPGAHWTALPSRVRAGIVASSWPAPLRWLDNLSLEGLERLVIGSPWLQRFLLQSHRRAIQALLPQLPTVRRVAIVGGGLFPRTALILRELLPEAQIEIIDASLPNLDVARKFIDLGIHLTNRRYTPGEAAFCDLLVIPLAFDGDRKAICRHPPAQAVLVHDWIGRPQGRSRIVSAILLKRINLVRA